MTFIMPRARAQSVPGRGWMPQGGPRGVGAGARIDDDQVLAIVQGLHEPVAHLRIGAADFQLLGPHDLGFGELAAPAVIIAVKPAVAGDQPVQTQPGAVADIARGDDIAGADGAGQAVGIAVVAAAGALGDGDGSWPVLGLAFLDLGGDGVQGLIPGDPLPFSFTLGAGSFQGIFEAVGVIDMLDAGQAPWSTWCLWSGSRDCLRYGREPRPQRSP